MNSFETNTIGDKLINLDYLIFGLFNSNYYGTYEIYKLTKSDLFVDKSESWHNDRHKKEGYNFIGQLESNERFIIVKDLLLNVPVDFLNEELKGFYTTGNKNEDKLIIEFSIAGFTKSVTIDSYEIDTNDLPINLKNFRFMIEEKLRELKR